MKTSSIIALGLSFLGLGASVARAQNYVLESKVALVATLTTQGTGATTTSSNGTVVKRFVAVVKPFTNREVLAEMLTRNLIGTPAAGWTLVYLVDDLGNSGMYASKINATPVHVPADLLTVPVLSSTVQTGTETTLPDGSTYAGTTEIASAAATIHGQAVSGLATNSVRTMAALIRGTSYPIDIVTATISLTGGGAEIVRGSLGIGGTRVTTLTALP